MASKRSHPYDEPPSPESSSHGSSGEEEEEEEQVRQTPIQTPSKQKQLESEEDEEDPEEDDEDQEADEESDADKTPPPSVKTPADTKKKVFENESDSGTESDISSHPSPKSSHYIAKPIVKESRSLNFKNAAKGASLTEKAKEEKAAKVSKPKKAGKPLQKKQGADATEEEEDGGEKKAAITRVWNLNDEIVVLQGMIDFKKENGKDPNSNHDEFYNFVKVKLSNVKLTKGQVMDKVRRLKKKFKNNLGKSTGGKDPEFSNPHELKSFKLSRAIWGDIDSNNAANVNSNSKTNSQTKVNVVGLPVQSDGNVVNVSCNSNHGKASGRSAKKIKISQKLDHVEEDMMEVDEEKKTKVVKDESNEGEKGFTELYSHLMKAFEGESAPRLPLLDGLKSCLSMVDSSKLEEWNRKWKLVRLAETDAYLSRLALIQEQTSWFSNAMKSCRS